MLDYKQIIDSSAPPVFELFRQRYIRNFSIDSSTIADRIWNDLLWHCWNKAVLLSDGFTLRGNATDAEEVARYFIRKGLDPDRVQYDPNDIRIKLPNLEYTFHLQVTGFTLSPTGCYRPMESDGPVIGLSPDRLYDFLYDFDGKVPDMKRASSQVYSKLVPFIQESLKRTRLRQMRETVVRALLEQHVAPLGIESDMSVYDDTVAFRFRKGDSEGTMSVPWESVKKTLQDRKVILACLRAPLRGHGRSR